MIELIAAGVTVLCALASIGFAIAARGQARRAEDLADAANDYANDAQRAAHNAGAHRIRVYPEIGTERRPWSKDDS